MKVIGIDPAPSKGLNIFDADDKKVKITEDKFNDILEFIPIFYPDGLKLNSAVKMEYTENCMYIKYDEEVHKFIKEIYEGGWIQYDHSYESDEPGEIFRDDELMAKSSMQEIKSMFTYFVRGERFCTGHWASMLKSGRILALLNRLQILRREFFC